MTAVMNPPVGTTGAIAVGKESHAARSWSCAASHVARVGSPRNVV
jgi:hypothetical protein